MTKTQFADIYDILKGEFYNPSDELLYLVIYQRLLPFIFGEINADNIEQSIYEDAFSFEELCEKLNIKE